MTEKDHLILTAVGPDQVGLVEKLSEFISSHGCNIEDSKMAVFCGEFAVILLITGEPGGLLKVANNYRAYSHNLPQERRIGPQLQSACSSLVPEHTAIRSAGSCISEAVAVGSNGFQVI
jgi:predicted amino acid-binding ACT domain protein